MNYCGLNIKEKGAISSLLITASLVFLLFVGLVYFVFGKVVPPNAIGLREVYFNIPGIFDQGFQKKGLSPGLHWKLPGFSTVHLLPRDFQLIHFNEEREPGYQRSRLEIPTADGPKVKTDITMIIRFVDGVHPGFGGPSELVNTFTLDPEKQLSLLSKKAEGVIKSTLTGLSTTDYYNPKLREERVLETSNRLNSSINPVGVENWAILLRRYLYSDANIDQQIFAKNLQEQDARLNGVQSLLAEAQAHTEKVRAEGDARIAVLKAEGFGKVQIINAEAEQYRANQYARGDKLVEEAMAEIERQKNSILAGPGGSIYVARQMLPILNTLRGGIVSGIDPYDVSSWIKRFVSRENQGGENAR